MITFIRSSVLRVGISGKKDSALIVLLRNSVKRFSGTTKVKIGIIGCLGLDESDIFDKYTTKVVENTIYGKPSTNLIKGSISGVECVYFSRHGREFNVTAANINYRANIWALKEEECTHILSTSIAGSLLEYIKPGDIVVINDFIDRTYGRQQTFYDREKNHPPGICHLPMILAICKRTRTLITQAAEKLQFAVHPTGTVVCIQGPRYPSKAECNMYRLCHGNVINMTLVPEVVLAKEVGICFAAVCLAIGYEHWMEDKDELNINSSIRKTFQMHISRLSRLIQTVVPDIAKENWDQTRQDLQDIVKKNILP